MPTYSYACTECDNHFDVVQSFTDDTLTTCDRCSGRLRKLFSPVGVVFKGSGFYHNDSREARKAATNGHSDRNGHGKSSTSSDDKSGTTEKSATSSSGTSGNGDKSDKSSSSSDSTAGAAASRSTS